MQPLTCALQPGGWHLEGKRFARCSWLPLAAPTSPMRVTIALTALRPTDIWTIMSCACREVGVAGPCGTLRELSGPTAGRRHGCAVYNSTYISYMRPTQAVALYCFICLPFNFRCLPAARLGLVSITIACPSCSRYLFWEALTLGHAPPAAFEDGLLNNSAGTAQGGSSRDVPGASASSHGPRPLLICEHLHSPRQESPVAFPSWAPHPPTCPSLTPSTRITPSVWPAQTPRPSCLNCWR